MIDYDKYKDEFEAELQAEIDPQTGEIKIGNDFVISPAKVLQDDGEAYNYYLRDFVNKKRAEYEDTILTQFPAPIAYFLYQTQHGYENENQRFQLLRSTWEAVIYVLYAFVLGEVNAKNFLLINVRVFNNQRIHSDHRGLMGDRLGWKLEAIKQILAHDLDHNSDLLSSAYITVDNIETLEDLNRERNSAAHIAALSPREAEERYEQLAPRVIDLLFELDFLEQVSFVRFSRTLGSVKEVRFSRFDGHSLQKRNHDRTFNDQEIVSVTPLLSDNCILIESAEFLFNVSPFIHFSLEGDNLKLCYFKQIDQYTESYVFELIDGQERTVSYACGDIANGIDSQLGRLL